MKPQVSIQLRIGDLSLPVHTFAEDYVIVRKSIDLKPCVAEVQMRIGGSFHRWAVMLLEGMTAKQPKIRIRIAPTKRQLEFEG